MGRRWRAVAPPSRCCRRARLAPAPEPVAGAATGVACSRRIAALEARLEEQEAALRRVLTLLIDWAERDERRAAASARRPRPPHPRV